MSISSPPPPFISCKMKYIFFLPYFLCSPHGSQHYWSRKFSLGVLSLFHLLVWISCCSFTAVWALFPLLSAFQTSSTLSLFPFPLPVLTGCLVMSLLCGPHPTLPSPSAHPFISCVSVWILAHLSFALLPTCEAFLKWSVCAWWNSSSLCGGSMDCFAGYSSQNPRRWVEILLLFMLSGQMTCFFVPLFFNVWNKKGDADVSF